MDQAGVSLGSAYKALGLTPGATLGQVKAAYRRLALQCHPDLNPENSGEFHRLSSAYQRIINKAPNEELQFESHFPPSLKAEQTGQQSSRGYRQATRTERMPILKTVFNRPMTVGVMAAVAFAFCGGVVIVISQAREDKRRMGVLHRNSV